MEASSFSDSTVRPEPVELTNGRGPESSVDWSLAALIFGGALALYAAIGYALYLLATVLV